MIPSALVIFMSDMSQKIIILIPVYNDWKALGSLLKTLETDLSLDKEREYRILVVNDGSIEPAPEFAVGPIIFSRLDLHTNVGHQKAIATGLSFIHHYISSDGVVVLDGDGEDLPSDIPRLIEGSADNAQIVFASRAGRQVSLGFNLFYFFYKILFRCLTGRSISFGHFLYLPRPMVDRLVYSPEIVNHLPAAIMKSNLPYRSLPVQRGKRLEGQSKMSFGDLLLHGLGAISVFVEKVATRLLVFSLIMIGLTLLGIGIILGIRWFTDLAIPGWASTIMSSLVIVLLQSFLLSLFTLFLFLSSGAQRKFIPALHYTDLTGEINT